MSTTRSKQTRLLRQTSVLHELQETQEKESMDGRYARLMTELAALCSDRSNVITVESLQFFASSGRAEPVKLERSPERSDSQQKSSSTSGTNKQDDLLSADAARRQRVEELTRFFMEAKSDIEFALGGGRDSVEAKEKDKEAESERDEDRDDAVDEDGDEDKDDAVADPEKELAKLHAKLLKDKLDNRVFNVLLSQIREQDPALYGAILCHPLVTGIDPKKDKKKKKKRKDRERKEKQPSLQGNIGAGMLTPDLTAEPLSDDGMKINISRFVAKSIAEGSLQGLMLSAKLVLSFLDRLNNVTEAPPPTLPLSSHLRVLRGEKAPEVKTKKASAFTVMTKEVTTPTKADQSMADTSTLENAEGNFESDLQSVVLEAAPSTEMDLDSDNGSIAKLRARLSRFGGDERDDGDEGEDEDDDRGRGEDSLSGEGVDEDALMARAIALSLSPEVSLRDQNEASPTSLTENKPDNEAERNEVPVVKTRPAKFSAEELMELGPFALPGDFIADVDAVTVVMALITQMTKVCLEYINSCQQGNLPNKSPVQPHPLTFMLLNSLLKDLQASTIPHSRWVKDVRWVAKWRLFSSCSVLSLYRVLEVHFFHVEVMGIAPASVGLGHVSKLDSQHNVGRSENGNPLLESLKTLVVNSMAGETAPQVAADEDVVGAIIFLSPEACSSVDVEMAAAYYRFRIREQAMAAWIRAFAIFYNGQSERHMILTTKLAECLKLARTGAQNVEWKFHQLDILCARLALPDLAQHFVPTCVDIVEHDAKPEGGRKDQSGDGLSVKVIDDSALQNAASKTGRIKAKWTPDVIRASLDSGSLRPRCLNDYISKHGPPGLLDAMMEIPDTDLSDDALNIDTLANAYEEMWDIGRKQNAEALDCISRLPSLVDLLRESILSTGWHDFSFKDSYELAHTPLIPILEKENHFLRPLTLNARIVLLRSLQDLMIQRLGGSRGDEPPALEFDPSRCAETMTLSDENRTAKQYTAKQWGMVMATTGCPPNTGIHEWGVRLDRCEKGHIFLGVCTRDASVATYVGGDRQGWGLIGTRALWHARSKVRGDYGDGFTTGSIVRVRLNTDSGALSFGVGDSDWGIAFDGLTQHGTLYPAIGLYQRDDQVTILPVQPAVDSSFGASSGEALELRGVAIPAVLKPFLHHAGALLESCCTFLSSTAMNNLNMSPEMQEVVGIGRQVECIRDYERLVLSYPLLFSMVTPLISSLSLIRSYHGLCSTLSMIFVPWCIRTVQCVERVNRALRMLASSSKDEDNVSPGNLVLSVAGEWELKSMAAGNIPAQQYHLTLSQNKDGAMHGRSSGPFTTVTLNGIARGTKVSFVEAWRQGGTCLVEGRLRADGTIFTGNYEDTKSHTSGCIVGNKTSQNFKDSDGRQWVSNQLVILEMVAANLLGYFGHALTNLRDDDLLMDNVTAGAANLDNAGKDDDGEVDDIYELSSSECSTNEYDEWVNSNLLEGGLPLRSVQTHLKSVLKRCSEITGFDATIVASSLPVLTEATKTWKDFVLPKALSAPLSDADSLPVGGSRVNTFLKDLIENRGEAAALDGWVSKHVGESPFVRLGGEPMKATRRTVCAAMIWHSGFLSNIKKYIQNSQSSLVEGDVRPHDNLMHIWRAAQRVIEWAIRAKNSVGSSYTVVAGVVIRKAQFLLEIEPSAKALAAAEAIFAMTVTDSGSQRIASKSAMCECAERIFSDVLVQVARFVEAPIRVSTLQSKMLGNCTAAFLRTIGMLSFRHFVGDSGSNHRGEVIPERNETIQSSFALSSALQWLSPTLAELNASCGRGPSLGGKEFGENASVVATPTLSNVPTTESSYYLSGLGGCGKHLKNDLRGSFESLYGYLSATLSKASWAHDADLQLVVLLAWGIIIEPDDHAFLSRVGIFRVLQTVLDEARGSSDMALSETRAGVSRTSPDDTNLITDNKKIVQAALKVVHLLAAQVAHASDTADGLLSASDVSSTPGLGLGSIPLLRKPSGPETLGKSVFHMLYTELKNSLEEMRQNRETISVDVTPTAFVSDPTQSSDPSASVSETSSREGLDDAQEYCYQICSLLYSVSGSPVCRSHLSSSRWLRLLLALVSVNSPQIQRRILKLLRRLLPSLDPTSIKVRYDECESFDMDSDEEYDADVQDGLDHATTLINFFVEIVGMSNPSSLVELMLRRQSDSNEKNATKREMFTVRFNAGGLAAEVVSLLRSLYESDKWAKYLNRAIADALGSIPSACVTEQEGVVTETVDSDVEMEDMSKETPSLKSWTTQTTSYIRALSALCIVDGHIEGIHVGGSVKIMPRSGSSLQEIAFRGARGVIVAYELEKSAAEVLLRGNHADETNTQQQPLLPSRSIPTRPVRVPIDDLFAVPEVELPENAFSDAVLQSLLVERFPYFLAEVKKSFVEVNVVDSLNEANEEGGNDGDSEDDDDMSNDGSTSPSAMDSEMRSGDGVDESDRDANVSSCHPKSGTECASPTEPADVMAEMEKESRLYRILLCQHGLRAAATLLKTDYCASTFIRGVGSTGLKDLLTVAISETPTIMGVGDIASLEESWLMLWSRWCAIRSAHVAPSIPGHVKEVKGKTSRADETDTMPSPIVQQMMEMGFPKEWCDVALARCSQNVEAAINFCFEHSSDMERLLAEYRSSREAGGEGSSKAARKDDFEAISPLLEQLSEMGFPFNWCKKALAANRNNVDAALTWILSNGEALEAEDRRDEEAKLRSSGGDDGADGNVPSGNREGDDTVLMPNPLRAVSGQACIGEHDLMVEGLVGGGFASVGAPDCLVSSGRWYYEAILHTNGCIQIGWADVAFCGAADRGDGVGDGAHSWAYDGWRQQRWHGRSSPWGSKWKQGDVVGCGVDADAGTIIFSLNGKMRSANMGVAFRAINFARGVYPCASFNRRERLQFNLGGTPFKYPPPPGFQPILNVLSDTYDLSSVPKGFEVIGSREDCLEESMGEENYSSDTRYFARDMHPSMLRSSGHSRSSGFVSGSGVTKADALADIKALPDNRVYIELLVITRSLAILQARRALLTLLAKWPTTVVGPFSVAAFLSDNSAPHATSESEDSSRFIDFIKLSVSLSALHVGNSLSSASLTLRDGDALHLLEYGATGRFALGLLSGVVKSALDIAFSTIIAGTCDRSSLIDTVLSCISSEVKRSSQRQYARIPWNSSEAAITATLLQITAEAGQTWSDKEVLNHPNLFLAEWISGLMLESLEKHKERLLSPTHDEIQRQLLEAWISSLKSPSMCVKERGATILGGIIQDILPKPCGVVDANAFGVNDDEAKRRLKMALDVLPLQRLVDLSQERILREYPNVPVCSKYVQSLVELLSAAGLAMSAVGQSTDTLFESSSSHQLQACKRIEADLEPIDRKEYEEVMAAKKLLQEQQEAVKLEKLAAERASAAEAGFENDASADLDAVNVVASNNDDTIRSIDEETVVARGSDVTNMEVDNSDSEEASDVTRSAIANMVTEDSDVNAGTAASGAGPGDRLASEGPGRRTKLPMPQLMQEKVERTFEFRLPEGDPDFDTSMLNTQETDMLEAAKRGIMGEEVKEWKHGNDVGVLADAHTQLWSGTLTQFRLRQKQEESNQPELKVGCKVIRGPNWKWRDQDGGEGSVGIVEGVSPWSGVDGEGMSVRWPNDSLYTYRWGADGNFDLIHVEVDEDGNITHQYPTPKAKQEDEGSFGSELHLGVLLYLSVDDDATSSVDTEAVKVVGVMEWPDYGAAVHVVGLRYPDGSLCIQELQLTRGNPDMGWMLRFGTEKWQPGSKYMLHPDKTLDSSEMASVASQVDVLRGEYSHPGIKDGKFVEIRGVLQLSTKYLFTMDHYNHFSTLGISSDGLSVTCHNGESRNLALGTVGFTTGIHYWEVHVEQAEFGSVFIGVCEKAGPPGSQAALSSRLNRWHGWGFVNFRATYHNSTERIYGDHFNASDTIGVRLDMEQGKLSFFMDGIKFGEHIVSDLGVAFENMKGERNSRTLYPCIGMRKGGDRVTLNQKWVSMPGVSPRQILSDAVDVSKALHCWYVSVQQEKAAASTAETLSTPTRADNRVKLPMKLLQESWLEWKRWSENHWQRCHVRPRGISVDFDTSPAACSRVSIAAGLSAPFLAGDRVRMCSKCGQELNQPEEAVILGVYRDFLWYRTETQGNEGADEGRAWAWYWSPSELSELILIRRCGKDMTLIENSAMDVSDFESSPEHSPFKPRSALEERARNDLNAFIELATRAHSTTSDMQLVERLNAYCAAIGLDVMNLKITDVMAPEEMEGNDKDANDSRGRTRKRSLVVDDYFTSPALQKISGPELRARTAVLKVLNSKILRVLPIIAIQPDDGSSSQPIEVASTKSGKACTQRSVEFLSTSLKLRLLRRLVFTSTKRAFWDDVLRATTTSTPLPSDEYEDPREIRVIRINRIQAQASKLSLLSQPGDRLRRSVFGQLYREMRAWSDSFFRRAYCGKGHGGQRRAFKVKFLGEGVNDYGGPYRAVFEQIVDELQMDNVELAKGEQGLLPLLIPCPNRRSATGSNQDKFLLNPSCGTALLANGPMALDLHRFLGKLIGTAVRHGLQMGLDLPALVWRPLAGLEVNRAHLDSIDVAAANNLSRVEELNADTELAAQEAEEVLGYLTMSTTLSDGVEVPLVPQGEKIQVTLGNRDLYLELVEKTRLTESSQQLAALKDGLASVLPMELAPLFTPQELEVLICGRREVDVDLLHQCTEYSEGADEAMPHVQHFWEVLREMTSEERTSFLRFVWARSRMPNSAKDFPMNFKLQAAHDPGAVGEPDKYLPHAQTCFFALRLPAYTNKEVLRTKLLYAIQNSPNMDADVRLHNAEGWADA